MANKKKEPEETSVAPDVGGKKKKGQFGKTLGIFLLFLILIPIFVMGILYFLNATVQEKANEILRKAPNPIGSYFEQFPTQEEKELQLKVLAETYLELNTEQAADKLLYVESQDGKLYHDLIDKMKVISYKGTEKILEEIQLRQPKKGVLNSLYEEIDAEKQKEFEDALSYLNGLDTYQQIQKIEMDYLGSYESIENLNRVLEKIDKDKLLDILYYSGEDTKTLIMSKMEDSLRDEMNQKIEERKLHKENLDDQIALYEQMDTEAAKIELTNENKYNLKDLSYIYEKLSTLKGADILRNTDNRVWVESLYGQMRLNSKNEGVTSEKILNLDKTMNFLDEYDKKIKDVADIYKGMTPDELKAMVEKMLLSDEPIETFQVDEEQVIEVSDSKIILDVLKTFDKKVLSLLLGQLDPRKAAELTRRLTI